MAAGAAVLFSLSVVRGSPTDPFSGALPNYETAAPKARDLGAGEAGVSGTTGAATYGFPIAVPPGRNGQQPQIGLTYSSQSAMHGGVAAGWTLSGLPTIDVDPTGGSGAKRFLAGGARLVAVQGQDQPVTYKDANQVVRSMAPFRAEFDSSFTRYGYYSYDYTGTYAIWVAEAPNGSERYFEFNDGVRWYMTRERDAVGNTVTYSWAVVAGSVELSKITYTTNPEAGLNDSHAQVDFIYADAPTCGSSVPVGAAIDRGLLRGKRKLTKIRTWSRDAPNASWRTVREVNLGYDAAAESCTGTAAPMRYLASITEVVTSPSLVTKTLPSITFGYGAKDRKYDQPRTRSGVGFQERGYHGENGTTDQVLLDMDGDGIPDELHSITRVMPNDLSPNGSETRCFLAWRKGRSDGAFESGMRDIKVPFIRWEDGFNPSSLYGERCSINGQVVSRVKELQSCTRRFRNMIAYHFLDWDADGRTDLLTNVWAAGGHEIFEAVEGVVGKTTYSDGIIVYVDCPAHSSEVPGWDCECDPGYTATSSGTECRPNDPLPGTPPQPPPPGEINGGSSGGYPGCEPLLPYPERANSGTNYLWRVYLNTGDPDTLFSRAKRWRVSSPWYLSPVIAEEELGRVSIPGSALPTLIDIDGDGFLDVVKPATVPSADGNYDGLIPPSQVINVWRGNGGTTFDAVQGWGKPIWSAQTSGGGYLPGPNDSLYMYVSSGAALRDMNADGLPDLIASTSNNLMVAWNTGRGFGPLVDLGVPGPIETTRIVATDWHHVGDTIKAVAGEKSHTRRLFDVDGDGRPDIVDLVPEDGDPMTPLPDEAKVRFNLGTAFSAPRMVARLGALRGSYEALPTSPNGMEPWRLRSGVIDADFDGIGDPVSWDGSDLTYWTDDVSVSPPRVLTSVSNGRGMVASYKYASSNSPAAQEGAASTTPAWVNQSPVWVVTSMSVNPGGGQPSMTTEYRYGSPLFGRKADTTPENFSSEPHRFVGFGSVRTRGGAPSGSAGGAESLRTFAFRAETGDLELTEEVLFARETAGFRPASITTFGYKTLALLGGLVSARLQDLTVTRTCLVMQTTMEQCRANSIFVQSSQSWLAWPSVASAKLYISSASEEYSSTEPNDARRKSFEFDVRYPSTSLPFAYHVLVKAENSYRGSPDGSDVGYIWQATGRTETTFDAYGLPTETRQRVDGATATMAVTKRTFDTATGNMLTERKPSQVSAGTAGKVATYEYFGNKVFPSLMTNELGHQVTILRDAGTGAVVKQVGPNSKTQWTCYPGPIGRDGKPTTICSPTSIRWDEEEWTLDGLGRVLTHAASFDIEAGGYGSYVIERFTYNDLENSVIEEHRQQLSPELWVKTSRKTDGLGRPTEERQHRQPGSSIDAVTNYEYDVAGKLHRTRVPDPSLATDSLVQANYNFYYDSLGRTTKVQRPDGTFSTVVYADATLLSGTRVTSRTVAEVSTDGTGATTQGRYDAFERLIEVEEIGNAAPTASDPKANAVTYYIYDDHDRLVEINDAEANSTLLTHDWMGRRTKIDREGRVWRYEYDLDGNMTGEVAPVPAGAVEALYRSTTTYDPLGRPLVHDPAMRGMHWTQRRALTIGKTHYEYDVGSNGKGQLTSVRQPRDWAASLPDFQRVDYTYAANGLVSIEVRSFNPKASVVANEGPLTSQWVKRGYNPMGQLVQSTWDDGQSWFTSYDARGLPQKVQYAATEAAPRKTVADYGTRSVAGGPRSRTTGSDFAGQARTWKYDVLGRPTEDRITVGTSVRASRNYAYWQTGDLKQVTGGNWSHTGAKLADAGAAFTFDKTHRLLTASGPSGYSAAMVYSATGNITKATIGGPASVRPRSVEYDYADAAIEPYATRRDAQAVNELRVAGTQTPYATFRYDPSGNMVERSIPFGVPMNMTWDGDDQLRQVSGAGASATETYHYDHAGQRVWAVSGSNVRFWFAESETQMPLAGGVATRYIHLSDGSGALGRAERTGTTIPVVELHYSDAVHNLMLSMGPGGQVEASFVYGAFGEVVHELGSGDHRRQFNGKETDLATGFRYYGVRSYDAVAMRWIAADPLFRFAPDVDLVDAQQQNLYQFSKNNPLRCYDPDGRRIDGLAEPRETAAERKERQAREVAALKEKGREIRPAKKPQSRLTPGEALSYLASIGFSIMGPGDPPHKTLGQKAKAFFSSYGDVYFRIDRMGIVGEALGKAEARFSGSTNDGEGDAWRHAYLAITLTRIFGVDTAKQILDRHERSPAPAFGSHVMDVHNNYVGIWLATESDRSIPAENLAQQALDSGLLITSPPTIQPGLTTPDANGY